ncbi:MAG: dienelactone hydrolase family protein [Bacteriovoracaceae bacterium]|nr:dienelactone hydrolase family protein [Bacteriovoracaceae bacterium]
MANEEQKEFESKIFEYKVIPAVNKGATDGSKWMVVMHGLGDNLSSYTDFCSELNLTGLNYLLINAPFSHYFGFSWYDLPPAGKAYNRLEIARDKISELIKEMKDFGISSKDIILMGFSQGGLMAIDQFISQKNIFAGVVALSPRVRIREDWEKLLSEKKLKTPMFLAHGYYDEQIPYQETFEAINSLKDHGFNIDFTPYEIGHTIDLDEIRALRDWLNNII